jgi:DNA-binding CsgD family transcriptional regulator
VAKLTKEKLAERTAEMVRLRKGGASYGQIASMFGVSEKCVQRTLKASGQMDKPASFYRLKPKKQKLALGVAQGLTPREAALEAGYSPATARSAGTDLVGPEEKRAVAEILLQEVPPALVAQRMREGVDATETRFIARGANAAIVEKTVPDFGERRQYVELWSKLTGALEAGLQGNVAPVQIILDI